VLAVWFIGKLVANGLRKGFHHKGLVDLGGVLSSVVFGLIVAASVLIASVIIFPSVKPATIISSLGIGSIAIGFAFKDILQNLLAGILPLINPPYRRGDQIVDINVGGRMLTSDVDCENLQSSSFKGLLIYKPRGTTLRRKHISTFYRIQATDTAIGMIT
jgi:hypothetical protein